MDTNQPDGSNRRDFLKSTSVLAGTALAGMTSAARFAHGKESNEIKVALIGCGGRGSGAIADMLSTTHPVKLWAVADMFPDRIGDCLRSTKKEFESKMDVPKERQFVGFDAYKDAIKAGVDVVILATPPGFRPIQFEAAVKAGKHVFMEKPVATDAAGVRKVLAAAAEAKQKNLGVGVGLQRRHDPAYIETIKRLQDGAIGDIVASRVYWNDGGVWVNSRKKVEADKGGPVSEMEYQLRNWYYFNWLCGDHIVEQHIHNMDVINWLKNAHPVRAVGMGGRQVRTAKEYGEIFDHHAVEFEYADGSRMFSQCRHIHDCWRLVGEAAHGSKGSSMISSKTIRTNGEPQWKYTGKSKNPYRQEHQDLLDSIAAGSPINEGEYGATSTMTAIFGRMATYSGKELKWDDALNSSVDIMPSEFSMKATPPTVPGPDGRYNIPTPGVTKVI